MRIKYLKNRLIGFKFTKMGSYFVFIPTFQIGKFQYAYTFEFMFLFWGIGIVIYKK